MDGKTIWVVVARSAKGKSLIRSVNTYTDESSARTAISREKDNLTSWAASHPTIVIDDDDFADDLYDVLRGPGVHFEAEERPAPWN